MKKELYEVNDVVQLNPLTVSNPMFGGCFMVVTEVKSWGCMGYVTALGKDGKQGGAAYYRANWDEFEYIGRAEWVIE